jgi:hypothetical protein
MESQPNEGAIPLPEIGRYTCRSDDLHAASGIGQDREIDESQGQLEHEAI